MDEASVGAEALVVIHATGAEIDALINGKIATGGEADHHGPIPQSSLRKHLIKALANTLLPNLPTTPTHTHQGTATHHPRLTPNTPSTTPDTPTPGTGTTRALTPRPAPARHWH